MVRQKHPSGLYVLFFTEMWERFGFYCMAALFVLYMTEPNNGHPFLQKNSSHIVGAYLFAVYFTPFFGGLLADRFLGYRWPVVLGGVALGLGYLFLAVDDPYLLFFFAGLTAIVVGNGLFKPNISTLVGKLYAPGDPRIDNAYTIFYMGINVGAFAAPLVAQYLRVHYGYPVAFAAAGVGMGLSVVLFLVFGRWLVFFDAGSGEQRAQAPEVSPDLQRRGRHLALLFVFFVVALFWMGFKQNTNTFNLWARDCTDRTPAPWLQSFLSATYLDRLLLDRKGMFAPELFSSVNPFFVVTFSPLLVWFWLQLKGRGREPSTPAKICLGMVLASLAFVVLAAGGLAGGDVGAFRPALVPFGKGAAALQALDPASGDLVNGTYQSLVDGNVGRVSPGFLFGGYAIITLGELCLSPIGLSLVTKLAAPKHRSAWMGGWFAATSVGGYLSGLVGSYWNTLDHSTFFYLLAATSLSPALLVFLLLRPLRLVMTVEKPAAAPVVKETAPAAT